MISDELMAFVQSAEEVGTNQLEVATPVRSEECLSQSDRQRLEALERVVEQMRLQFRDIARWGDLKSPLSNERRC